MDSIQQRLQSDQNFRKAYPKQVAKEIHQEQLLEAQLAKQVRCYGTLGGGGGGGAMLCFEAGSPVTIHCKPKNREKIGILYDSMGRYTLNRQQVKG